MTALRWYLGAALAFAVAYVVAGLVVTRCYARSRPEIPEKPEKPENRKLWWV